MYMQIRFAQRSAPFCRWGYIFYVSPLAGKRFSLAAISLNQYNHFQEIMKKTWNSVAGVAQLLAHHVGRPTFLSSWTTARTSSPGQVSLSFFSLLLLFGSTHWGSLLDHLSHRFQLHSFGRGQAQDIDKQATKRGP